MDSLPQVSADVVECFKCPRLVAWRELVAQEKRAAYRDWEYWGRPVPGFGDPAARLLIVGLAPAFHGGNRHGRVFTGDQSAAWLWRALHELGLASSPTSVSASEPLRVNGVYVTNAVRCAPPGNRPLPREVRACRRLLEREMNLLPYVTAILALGKIAHEASFRRLLLRTAVTHTVAS